MYVLIICVYVLIICVCTCKYIRPHTHDTYIYIYMYIHRYVDRRALAWARIEYESPTSTCTCSSILEVDLHRRSCCIRVTACAFCQDLSSLRHALSRKLEMHDSMSTSQIYTDPNWQVKAVSWQSIRGGEPQHLPKR